MSVNTPIFDFNRVYVCDGAMGTMLHASGIPLTRCFDEVNLSQPEIVEQIHRAYVNAGAQIIETNTFGANKLKLEGHGLGRRVREINLAAVEIAKRVANGHVLVAGSIGPTGKLMQPFGPLDFNTAVEVYEEQILALCEGGVDFLIVETMQDIREAKAAILAASRVSRVPVVAQMSFGQEGKSMMGTPPEVAAVVLGSLEVSLVGTNCGTGPQDMLSTVQTMAKVTSKGISAQPNAGLPTFYEGRLIYLSTPEYVASLSKLFVENGAVLVGGCCGTTPGHIEAIAKAVANMQPSRPTVDEVPRLASRTRLFEVHRGQLLLIGSRLGHMGKECARLNTASTINALQDAVADQYEKGADVICLDLDLVSLRPRQFVESVQARSQAALCLTSSRLESIEEALHAVEGRAMVMLRSSSSSGIEDICDLARRYGALVVVKGDGLIVRNPDEMMGLVRSFLLSAEKSGLSRQDVLFYVGDLLENSKPAERVFQFLDLLASQMKVGTIASIDEVDNTTIETVRRAVGSGLGLLLTNLLPNTLATLENIKVSSQGR
jgi:5-methyltetrahydrofolate--homocysteine methyltransferase